MFETGRTAELVAVDLTEGERHGATVPHSIEVDMSIEGEGPVLVADGQPMSDSVFIACFLNDSADGSPIAPADPYARWEMMTWCRQIIERTAPAAAYLGTKAHLSAKLAALDDRAFEKISAAIQSEDLKARWTDVRAGRFDDDKLEDSRTKIGAAADKIEKQLVDGRQWLLGAFSIADLETYAWLAGMRDVVPDAFAGKPKTNAWFDRVKARASVTFALSFAKSSSPQNVWAPGPEINRWG